MTEDEFDEFYTASFARVTGQVYAMIGDRDEAQECVQEAFVRAWAHRRKLERSEHPEAGADHGLPARGQPLASYVALAAGSRPRDVPTDPDRTTQ